MVPPTLMGLLCTVALLPPVAEPGHDESGSQRTHTVLNFRCHTVNVSGSPMGQLNQVRVNTNQTHCKKI